MYFTTPGITDFTLYIRLRDSTTGLAKVGLAFNSAGASCSYTRPLAAAQSLTLATLASATAAHSDGGFVEVHNTIAKGLYRLDLPDAAVAVGAPFVVINIEFDGVIEEGVLISLAPPVDVQMIDGSSNAALYQKSLILSGVSGTVQSGSSATLIETNLSGYATNRINGRTLYFDEGSTLEGEAAAVTTYDEPSGQITVAGLTQAPVSGDTFKII